MKTGYVVTVKSVINITRVVVPTGNPTVAMEKALAEHARYDTEPCSSPDIEMHSIEILK